MDAEKLNGEDIEASFERLKVDPLDAVLLIRVACRRLGAPAPNGEFIMRCMLDAACEEVEGVP